METDQNKDRETNECTLKHGCEIQVFLSPKRTDPIEVSLFPEKICCGFELQVIFLNHNSLNKAIRQTIFVL